MAAWIRALFVTVVGVALLAACGAQATPPAVSLVSGEALAPVDPATVSGPIEITGSSTVYPLTARIAEEFHAEGSRAQIDIKVTGTGGGLRSFCNGDPVEIVNASRPINDKEIAACRAVGRDPIGFPVGVDALAVVVNPQNTFVEALTFDQLAQVFSGQARTWDQVDPAFPAEPIAIFSPGVDSGTFDFFVEEVLGGDESQILALPDAVLSEDDIELVLGIEANPYAIGYFGYAYYQAEGDRLRAVPLDRGAGAIAPGSDTVADKSYPLARPLFVYTSQRDLVANPAAAAFLSYYLQTANDVIADVGYFAPQQETVVAAQQDLVSALR